MYYSLFRRNIELFVVKYEFQAGKQASLQAHVDGTPWSFVIALNDSNQYSGGGTRFIESETVYRPQKAGSAILFSGKNLHEGVALTAGVRYILTGFCEYEYDIHSGVTPHAAFMKDYSAVHDGLYTSCLHVSFFFHINFSNSNSI